MDVTALTIAGAWVFTPTVHGDDRGSFSEWFRADVFEKTVGHRFELAQANSSVSAAGTIRGIHFAELPPSQAKYVTCAAGRVLDVVVDIRTGSPTFGRWESVELDPQSRRVVYLSEGLGHAFLSLEDGSVVNYLCSTPYAPGREHGVNPHDPGIGIEWPGVDKAGRPLPHLLSPKDLAAPSLDEAASAGILPSYEAWQQWTESRVRPT